MEKAARAASCIALTYFHAESHIRHKTTHQNIVTAADTQSQEMVQKTIIDECIKNGIAESEIGFIGEEHLESKGSKHLFIIDPIDGTSNFASGLDYFSIAIAHVENGKMKDALVYWPTRDTLYTASLGKGAFKSVRGGSPVPLNVRDELLCNSLVYTYLSTNDLHRQRAYPFIERIYKAIRGIRINGSMCLDLAALCDSENAVHIVVNFHAYLWDVAAASLIIAESGGKLYDFSGNEMNVDIFEPDKEYSFIATHPSVFFQLKKYLS